MFLIFIFQYLIYLKIKLFFYINFFINFENNLSYLESFYLSFFIKFNFLENKFLFWIKLNQLLKY
jgi:hypothetical protein